MKDTILKDREGRVIKAGEFFHFEGEGYSVLPGPYQYRGYDWGTHIFRLPGMDLITSHITSERIVYLPWKRWRKPKERIEEALEFFNRKRKSGVLQGSSSG